MAGSRGGYVPSESETAYRHVEGVFGSGFGRSDQMEATRIFINLNPIDTEAGESSTDGPRRDLLVLGEEVKGKEEQPENGCKKRETIAAWIKPGVLGFECTSKSAHLLLDSCSHPTPEASVKLG